MATAWFIQREAKTVGPLSAQQLRELALAGKLRSDDLVRKDGGSEFTSASQVKNLFAPDQAVARSTPPPPRLPSLVVSAGEALSETVEPVAGSSPVAASASWFNRLLPYLTTARGKLADFGEQAKQAGELGSLVARRTQLQQHQLPQAFSALGAHVYAERRFADEFLNHFAEIDEAVSRQSKLAGAGTSESQPEDIAGKVKGAADGLLRRGKGASIGLKLKTLHRKLGEAVYRQHGPDSGPAELVAAIENAEAEIREVQQRIDELEAAGQGRVLTPRRLLVAGAVVTALFVVIILTQVASPPGRVTVDHDEHTRVSTLTSAPIHEIAWKELQQLNKAQPLTYHAVSNINNVDFSRGPNGEKIERYHVRYESSDQLRAVVQFYRDDQSGKPVFHGPFIVYSESGVKLHEHVMVCGEAKAHSEWMENGIPKQIDIYTGDEDYRRYQFNHRRRDAPPGTITSYEQQRGWIDSPSSWSLNAMTSFSVMVFAADNGNSRMRSQRDGLFVKLDTFGNVESKSLFRNGEEVARWADGGRFKMGDFSSMNPTDERVFQQELERAKRHR